MTLDVHPQPTDEEMAAILVAHEVLWPRPSTATTPPEPPRWRFAGRHWVARPGYGGWR